MSFGRSFWNWLAAGGVLLRLSTGDAEACTLWGEAGEMASGGTIISKIRIPTGLKGCFA